MFTTRWIKYGLMTFSLLFFLMYILELDAFARVGGGRSMGSRGSRSYSAPRSPSVAPSGPSRQAGQAPSAPMTQPQSGGFFRNIGGSLVGGLVGGMLGGMLFRSMGFAGGGGFGGGIGLFEVLLIGSILYGIWWFLKKKRQAAEATAGSAFYHEASMPESRQQVSSPPSYGQQAAGSDVDAGLGYVRQMDPAFDETRFTDQCMDTFFKIQGAWINRTMASVRHLLTDEMYRIIQGDIDGLIQKKQINRLENIAVRNVDLTEVWQESGRDFITVRFYANLLDYTTDEMTGAVVSGSKTDPVKFEEFWTFTRPVGNNSWQLAAINQSS